MDKTWQAVNFETAPGGISSAVSPDLLPITQNAWAMNADFRGGKPATRPNFNCRLILPSGLYQGGAFFGVQGGMIVVSIKGSLFRLRIGSSTFSFEPIPLTFQNSGIIKQVWMQQTIETLVIQDGQSSAILYNGSTATRAGTDQVPRGRMMAYGNGRLWVAIGERQLVAGDIRTNTPGSELFFTETNYLSGGGALYFPRGVTGLAFNAVTGTSDYGTLIVGGLDYAQSIRADITQRDLWQTYPGFVTNVLRNIGMSGQWGITEVNQDLYWRDSQGGIRSLRSAIQDEGGPGSAPVSREVSRLVNFDSQQLLPWCSSVYFDNRLLMTSSPFLNINGGVSWRNLVSLDFAPISTMQGKLAPAYNGAWSGVNWAQLIAGKFNGRQRAFGISADDDGVNRLWEFSTRDRDDVYLTCGSGRGEQEITAFVEYPRIDFGSPKSRKRLTRCDVWLSDISGDVDLKVYWRADNFQKWSQWDEGIVACAVVTDPAENTPHTWKNLLAQERPRIKSFTIPVGLNDLTDYELSIGFQFQIRLVWTGRLRIQRCMLWCDPKISDTDYADRDEADALCVENDVTGNEISYEIPIDGTCETFDFVDILDDIPLPPDGPWEPLDPPEDPTDIVIVTPSPPSPPTVSLPRYGCYRLTNGERIIEICSRTSISFQAFCRKKSGVAQQCGYQSFIPDGRYWVDQDWSGSITIGKFSSNTCETVDCPGPPPFPACNPGHSGSYNGATYSYSVDLIGWDAGLQRWVYRLSASISKPTDPGLIPDPNPGVVQVSHTPTVGVPNYEDGDLIYADPCSQIGGLYLYPTNLSPIPGSDVNCWTPSADGPIGNSVDAWNFHGTYAAGLGDNPPTCNAVQENNSERSGNALPDKSLTSPQAEYDTGGATAETTATEIVWTGTDICQPNADDPGTYIKFTGSMSQVLSNEDTLEDAIERLMNTLTWGDYLPTPGFVCENSDCCTAFQAEAVDGAFSIQNVEWRLNASTMNPGTSYNYRVRYFRRDVDGGDYELFQTETGSMPNSAFGTGQVTDKPVPNEAGFETLAIDFAVVRA